MLKDKAGGLIKQTVMHLRDGVNQLLWPAVCEVCGDGVAETDGLLCKGCWDELLVCTAGDYCRRCGRDASKYAMIDGACANCHGVEIAFDGIARGGVYDGALRSMILRFKFQDRTEFNSRLSMLADSALQGSGFMDRVEMFVPVPLHWRRRLGRGYNQSLIICKSLRHPSANVNTDLVRIRYTQRQWNLSPQKRRRNVADAFAVRKGHDFSGRTICLVDDITTSGATLNECAKTLKEAGAAEVYALVVTVAMQDLRS